MPSFNELQQRLAQAQFRKTILSKLIEYIDETFCPIGNNGPKNFLITNDQVTVPVAMFESVVADTLTPEIRQLETEIANILNAELAPPPADPEVQPTPEEAKEPA